LRDNAQGRIFASAKELNGCCIQRDLVIVEVVLEWEQKIPLANGEAIG
jgi:hypothetical protein